jgi:hypothetical protein
MICPSVVASTGVEGVPQPLHVHPFDRDQEALGEEGLQINVLRTHPSLGRLRAEKRSQLLRDPREIPTDHGPGDLFAHGCGLRLKRVRIARLGVVEPNLYNRIYRVTKRLWIVEPLRWEGRSVELEADEVYLVDDDLADFVLVDDGLGLPAPRRSQRLTCRPVGGVARSGRTGRKRRRQY